MGTYFRGPSPSESPGIFSLISYVRITVCILTFSKWCQSMLVYYCRPKICFSKFDAWRKTENISWKTSRLESIGKSMPLHKQRRREKKKNEKNVHPHLMQMNIADLILVEFQQIDWHDFTVVATIEFTNADDAIELPPPTSLTDLEYATLEQKRMMVNYDPDVRRLEAMPEDNPYAPPTRQQVTVTPAQPTPTPTEPRPAQTQEVDMEISDGE